MDIWVDGGGKSIEADYLTVCGSCIKRPGEEKGFRIILGGFAERSRW